MGALEVTVTVQALGLWPSWLNGDQGVGFKELAEWGGPRWGEKQCSGKYVFEPKIKGQMPMLWGPLVA